jgi:hypothetical protein
MRSAAGGAAGSSSHKPTQNPKPVQSRHTFTPPKPLPEMPGTTLSIAFRNIKPNWRNYVFYADAAAKAGDENMVKFVAAYVALPPKEQKTIMPEKLCDLAGITPGDLIGAVAKEVWTQKQPESIISASMNHPLVVERTAQYAMEHADNYRDRELFLRITGTLPDKKGASIVINNSPQTANINSPAGANGYKSMDQRVLEMGKILDNPQPVAVPLFTKEADNVFFDPDQSED